MRLSGTVFKGGKRLKHLLPHLIGRMSQSMMVTSIPNHAVAAGLRLPRPFHAVCEF
jgi:hypothetical protein